MLGGEDHICGADVSAGGHAAAAVSSLATLKILSTIYCLLLVDLTAVELSIHCYLSYFQCLHSPSLI